MGGQNVRAARDNMKMYSRDMLSLQARLVLIEMSVAAYDVTTKGRPPRRYYGGHDQLAMILGYSMPDLPGPDVEPDVAAAVMVARKPGEEAVRRAITQLVTAGAIKKLSEAGRNRTAGRNRHAEYELLWKPVRT